MPLVAGTHLGDCEILGPLGSGGMGEVYRARDSQLGREVAVKVLTERLASDPDRMRRFEQEARAAAALSHPNILAVYRFGTTDNGAPYMITELLQGQTLRERLEQGPIPVKKVAEYGVQIARGLAAAHERGIVHRDLKPDNIFLTRDGHLKILDFGVAKLTSAGDSGNESTIATLNATQPGLVLGTAGYMSPEQVRGYAVDARSDIFSLGAILYEMLSGRRAFSGVSTADTMSAILKDEPEDLYATVPNLPPAITRIVSRCLEKDPAERFQTARDLAFNLELLTRDESGSAAAAVAQVKRSRPSWLFPVIGSAALLLAVGIGFLAGRGAKPKAQSSNPVTLRRLTDFVGMEEYPALSPDGRAVAFTFSDKGERQIWVRLLNGGSPLQITHDKADHQSPRWSADSASLLYFTPSNHSGAEGQVWEVPALGGTSRPIISSLEASDPSHDGKKIAFFRSNQGQVELAVADRDGSNVHRVVALPFGYTYWNLRWSPDDQLLAYECGRVFDYDVYFVPAKGGNPQKMTHEGNPQNGFAWLPDNKGVVFSSSRGDTLLYLPTMNLWSIHMGDAEARQLTFGDVSYLSPDVGRDGSLVSSRTNIDFDIWKYPVAGSPLENVHNAIRLTHQTGVVQTPSVSPDDKQMVYLSNSGGHGNLWIMNLESGQNRQLTFEQSSQSALGLPVWSPDGKNIAYAIRSKTVWNVDQWVVSPDGTGAHMISAGGGWACWSPDSKWLYLSTPTDTGFKIEKMTADGNNVVMVQQQGQKPAVASDGTLYYTVSLSSNTGVADMEIHKANPETADGPVLARIPGNRFSTWLLMQPVLSGDNKWLAMALTDGGTTNLWVVSTVNGSLRQVTDFGYEATFIGRRVSWSPDGKFIYAAVGRGNADIVVLNNLF